jgi:hypothetical protein
MVLFSASGTHAFAIHGRVRGQEVKMMADGFGRNRFDGRNGKKQGFF